MTTSNARANSNEATSDAEHVSPQTLSRATHLRSDAQLRAYERICAAAGDYSVGVV
jgi:hypothetical protein